jgi:hypothetical protein
MIELNNIDNIKELILNNQPIEEKLNVIAVVENHCNYKIISKLTNEFIKKMENEPNVIVYLVELVYGKQEFEVTQSFNKRHLQIRTDSIPLWHKENMINLCVKYLLPREWKAFAWIDIDVEFDSAHWVLDTLKILNNGRDIIQLFTHCLDIDFNKQIIDTFIGFGYQYTKNFQKGDGQKYWHPGFAWACNRKAYEKMGCIFEEDILGSTDNIMCNTFIQKAPDSLKKGMSREYIELVTNLQNNIHGLTLGYVPGTIKHFFNEKNINLKYSQKEDIFIKYQYNPHTFKKHDSNGLIILTPICTEEFIQSVTNYFQYINEDEIALEKIIKKDKTTEDVLEYKINFILQQFEKLQKKKYIFEDDPQKFNKEISKILSLNTSDIQTTDIKPIVSDFNIIYKIPGIKYVTIPYYRSQKIISPHILPKKNIQPVNNIRNKNIITDAYYKHNTFKNLSFKQ